MAFWGVVNGGIGWWFGVCCFVVAQGRAVQCAKEIGLYILGKIAVCIKEEQETMKCRDWCYWSVQGITECSREKKHRNELEVLRKGRADVKEKRQETDTDLPEITHFWCHKKVNRRVPP
ncbi:uncharacterized protein IWZ02DRAFT_459503 [Phyllosticta citriasiana]|uniref:uncharacterized protein n=1 Tax=Phyllosticta citriasiana TaxID=595635 RepID=UPI0030FDD49B